VYCIQGHFGFKLPETQNTQKQNQTEFNTMIVHFPGGKLTIAKWFQPVTFLFILKIRLAAVRVNLMSLDGVPEIQTGAMAEIVRLRVPRALTR
jgi:hypothetical protein